MLFSLILFSAGNIFLIWFQPSPLFQKIEASTMAELKKKFAGTAPIPTPKSKQQAVRTFTTLWAYSADDNDFV